MKLAAVFGFITCIAVATGTPARSADSSYIGSWLISDAVLAPWSYPEEKPTERSRLMGKTIVFKPREITGPPPFPCKAPHYKEIDYGTDMIFQGAFDDMRSKNKSIDPDKLAASLGFPGKSIRTLETGCDIDFHFVDATTAKIGLNNYVYTLKKQ